MPKLVIFANFKNCKSILWSNFCKTIIIYFNIHTIKFCSKNLIIILNIFIYTIVY